MTRDGVSPRWGALAVVCLSLSAGCGDSDGDGDLATLECSDTFNAIQRAIFEGHGCTASTCHGQPADMAAGGLDLRSEVAYESLLRVESKIDSSVLRVHPGNEDLSLLYLKLQAATNGQSQVGTEGLILRDLGQPMPASTAPPLSEQELQAVRLWILGGAPRGGVVEGTMELLSCAGTFEADPNKIEPLPPPAADQGLQFYSGAWPLDAETEREVCFATYYDVTDTVPASAIVDCPEYGEGRKCFGFNRSELAQDGQSHHSIITVYTPESEPLDAEAWGPWACLGGARDGEACDPTDPMSCGSRSACATLPQDTVGCIAYAHAPKDFSDLSAGALGGASGSRAQLQGSQASAFVIPYPEGVYQRLPLRGFVAWSSHAFNLTRKDTTIEQWVNLDFAEPTQRRWLFETFLHSNDIFKMTPVDPFAKREVCTTFVVPERARVIGLTSHYHQFGEVFRIWGPPNEPCTRDDCAPPQREPMYTSRLYDDPVYQYYDPPLPFDSADEAERTFKACAVWDNGADNPALVKRHSKRPNAVDCDFQFAYCGCEPEERACLFGDKQGALCGGDDEACGEGGLCDACPVKGGVLTTDEMFLPTALLYVERP